MKRQDDPRHNSRRLVFAVLFSQQLANSNIIESNLNDLKTALKVDSFDKDLFDNLIFIINTNYSIIIEKIDNTKAKWKMDQIFATDKCILILSAAELLFTDTPTKVIIDEAIELAKELSLPESTKFINGILANVESDKKPNQEIYETNKRTRK